MFEEASNKKQITFNFYSKDKKRDSIFLELKPYIQPFERILAQAELAGLVEPGLVEKPFESESNNTVTLLTATPEEWLRQRLAYWQRVGGKTYEPTLQVLYETSQDWLINEKKQTGVIPKKITLPKQRRLRYGPHNIHEYRGKFFPQLVKSLINTAKIPEGGIVLDPMCGSGTTNCESRAMGMVAIGLDLNPLSIKIAKTKTSILDIQAKELLEESKNITDNIRKFPDSNFETYWNEKDLNYLRKWFDDSALLEIYQILNTIKDCENPILKDLFEINLSNILRRVSWQKIDDLRVRKKQFHYRPGFTMMLFSEEVYQQTRKLVPYLTLIKNKIKLKRFEIMDGDIRHISAIIPNSIGKCDILITSPPYAMALPYLDTDRLSLIVLGLLQRKEHNLKGFEMVGNREITEKQRIKIWEAYHTRRYELPKEVCGFIDNVAKNYHNGKVGFRRRNLPALLSKYFLDMTEAMMRVKGMMKPNHYGYFIVGNNSTNINGKRLDIPTNKFLWKIGKKVGWKPIKMINMELLTSRDIFRKNRGTSETILVFKSGVKV